MILQHMSTIPSPSLSRLIMSNSLQ